jgi:hypothetical protein
MNTEYISIPGKKAQLITEPSTNTHVLHAENISYKEIKSGVMHIKTESDALITHGDVSNGRIKKGNHNSHTIASRNFFKVVQQEYNPVTREMQNAFD